MVEPIPFYGLFDDQEPESYLREQLQVQQRMINQLQQAAFELQDQLVKAQTKIDALSIPGMYEFQNYGWEMTRNPDGTYTMKPIPESKDE